MKSLALPGRDVFEEKDRWMFRPTDPRAVKAIVLMSYETWAFYSSGVRDKPPTVAELLNRGISDELPARSQFVSRFQDTFQSVLCLSGQHQWDSEGEIARAVHLVDADNVWLISPNTILNTALERSNSLGLHNARAQVDPNRGDEGQLTQPSGDDKTPHLMISLLSKGDLLSYLGKDKSFSKDKGQDKKDGRTSGIPDKSKFLPLCTHRGSPYNLSLTSSRDDD